MRWLGCGALAASLVTVRAPDAPALSCSIVDTWRHRWDEVELPWVLYTDQNCPSDRTGELRVDDSAIWSGVAIDELSTNATTNALTSGTTTHAASKLIGSLDAPKGLQVAGGELIWVEQGEGTMKRCPVEYQTASCLSPPSIVRGGLNCPQDLALDYSRGHAYVIQYGGGSSSDAALSCGGEPRITRFDLGNAADGSSQPTDVVTPATVGFHAASYVAQYRFLALDPMAGYLFWTDPGRLGGALMRADLDGANPQQLMLLLAISGVAVDTTRRALYVTHAVPGASLLYSSYDGRWQKHVSSQALFEPRGIAVDPTDGSVAIVEFDTFDTSDAACEPTANGGAGALACTQRNLGRISRVSCAWNADTTVTGRAPGPFECCCAHDTGAALHMGCALVCLPPGVTPPASPPLPPGTPPGIDPVNYTYVPPTPLPYRDYGTTIIDNETSLYVGGYVTTGTQAISWGDPTHVALVTATRLPPIGASSGDDAAAAPPPVAASPPLPPGPLLFGNCTPGCGRPTGVDDCAPCGVGSYGDGDGVCRLCPPGTSGVTTRATTRAAACMACAAGTYNPVHGATACRPCPPGAFCADGWGLSSAGTLLTSPLIGGIPLPTLCPMGTYGPEPGNAGPEDCIACPAGTAAPGVGGTSFAACVPCPRGMSNGNPGMGACNYCTPSQAQPRLGQAFCDICGPGQYSDGYGATACSPCPLGAHAPFSGEHLPNCTDCPAGTYGDATGRRVCVPCPNGTASAAERATSDATCTACAPGTYNNQHGVSACLACPADGEFVDVAAAAACEANGGFTSAACPANRFHPLPASTAAATLLAAAVLVSVR